MAAQVLIAHTGQCLQVDAAQFASYVLPVAPRPCLLLFESALCELRARGD